MLRLRTFVASSAFILALLVSIGLLMPHGAGAAPPDLLPGVDIIGDDGIASNAADSALKSINKAVADATTFITTKTMGLVLKGSDPTFTGSGSTWFIDQYGKMMTLSFTIMLMFAVISFTAAMVKGDTGQITSTLANIFLAVFLTYTAVAIVQYSLWFTDSFSDVLMKGWDKEMNKFVKNIAASYSGSGSGAITQVFLGIMLGVIMVLAAAALLVVMLVRGTLIYLTVLFLPFLFACLIWPAWRSMLMVGVRFLTAMVVSKFVIVAILSASAAALAGATAGADKASEGLFTAVFGIAAFVMSALSPIALLNWLPGFQQAASGAKAAAGAAGGFAGGMIGQMGKGSGSSSGGAPTPVSAPGGAGSGGSTPGAGGGLGVPGGPGGGGTPGSSPGGAGASRPSGGSAPASSGGSGPSAGPSGGTPGGPSGGTPMPSMPPASPRGSAGASGSANPSPAAASNGSAGAPGASGVGSSSVGSPHVVGGSAASSDGGNGPHEVATRAPRAKSGSNARGGRSAATPPASPRRVMQEPRTPIRLDKTSSEIGSV